MKQFEDKFMEVQASMISLGLEYTKEQVDRVYIYAIADGFYRFDIFLFYCLTKTTSCASGSEKLLAMYQKSPPKVLY